MSFRRKSILVLLFGLSGLLGFGLSWYQHYSGLSQEISAVSLNVPLRRETFHYPTSFIKQLEGDPKRGKKIFYQFCASCHLFPPLIAVNAPLIGDKAAWQARKRIPLSTLLEVTIRGIGAMPARGGCFECNDKQLEETIRYMLDR